MDKITLLQTQQSMLQSSLDNRKLDIAFTLWAEDLKSLHKKQYAETKLLKAVERQIREEADKARWKRVHKEVEEASEPFVAFDDFYRSLGDVVKGGVIDE